MNKLYKKLKTHRKLLLFLCDFCLWNVSYYISFVVNKSSFVLKGWEEPFMWGLLFINIIFTAVFLCFRLYDKMWRYADIEDFFYAGIASLTANLVFMSFTMIIGTDENRLNYGARIYIIMSLLSTFLTFIFRLVYRLNKIIERKNTSNKNRRRLLIVGGGEGAATVLSELAKSPENEYVPICLVDDDPEKIGRRIGGVKIEGSTYDIPEICEREDIEVILFTISQINLADKKRILDICAKTHLEVKIIPNVYGLIKDGASVTSKIRQVEVEDLLGREPIVFDTEKYGAYITGQTVLVTGGGGSIGSELCRQIAKLSPKKLIILDIYENNAYEIQQELIRQYHEKLNLDTQIASVRDKRKLDYLFSQNKIDVIFHAAAHMIIFL